MMMMEELEKENKMELDKKEQYFIVSHFEEAEVPTPGLFTSSKFFQHQRSTLAWQKGLNAALARALILQIFYTRSRPMVGI